MSFLRWGLPPATSIFLEETSPSMREKGMPLRRWGLPTAAGVILEESVNHHLSSDFPPPSPQSTPHRVSKRGGTPSMKRSSTSRRAPSSQNARVTAPTRRCNATKPLGTVGACGWTPADLFQAPRQGQFCLLPTCALVIRTTILKAIRKAQPIFQRERRLEYRIPSLIQHTHFYNALQELPPRL